MSCEQLCASHDCAEHIEAPKHSTLSRRGLLAGFAGVVATIGLTSIGDAAMAASKTYVACKTTDVQVGGAKLVTLPGTNTQVVITRPKASTYVALSPYCTHQTTLLSGIQGSNLICQRHGATFNTTTGAATGGPTRTGLKKYPVTISGTSVKVTA
jgi:nitrite reductase/ring-hydroxylating ferredoxin subunit